MRYKRFRNELAREISAVKHNYYRNRFENNNGNPKQQWGIMTEIMGETINDLEEIVMKDVNNKIISCQKEVSGVLMGFLIVLLMVFENN